MTKGLQIFADYLRNEEGATAIEYGLIAALIGIGLMGGAKAFSDSVNTMFSDVDSELVIAYTPPASG